MFKDKRIGVIRSDLYENSIYSDKIDLFNGNDSVTVDGTDRYSRYTDKEPECFNDYSVTLNNKTKFSDDRFFNNTSSNLDSDSDKDTSINKRRTLVCNLCKLDSHKDYIFVSCCNSVFHIKCLIDKYTKEVFCKSGNGNEQYNCFNENTITQESFDKIICVNCDNNVNYEDIFTLYSKNVLCNKKFYTKHITQLNLLKDQKTKIENEIKCLNEYVDKLENEKNLSKIIMDKTYKLLSE
jgi:hypothetical protein